ncbi:MAG: FecR domain-containing protein [Alphaproteobacteria bacterium]|nr:FecR domain-containing protein [Alphaproteobacteria bacterium]
MSSNQIDAKTLEQAGDYYLSLQDGTMNAEELKAWQGWMAESDIHRRAFARMETLWGVLGVADESDWQLIAQDSGEASEADPAPAAEAAGGSVLSLVAPVAREAKTPRPRMNVAWYGAIAATFALVFVTTFLIFGSAPDGADVRALRYETAASQQQIVNLADGSIVELGAGSAMSVRYTQEARSITLDRGEAVFTVAKNPKRPFVVHAGQGSVTAIGTVFNVRKSAANVQVRVLEGTVAVRPVDEQGRDRRSRSDVAVQPVALVTAGSQTEYSPNGTLAPVEMADVYDGLSWRVGVLTMVDWPISDVIAELNRYVTDEITIGDEVVGTMRFTGTVYPDQIEAWLEGLQEGYPIEVVRLGGSTILMVADERS